MLVGHSFGGKGQLLNNFFFLFSIASFISHFYLHHPVCSVVLSMVDQAAKPLARPVKVSSNLVAVCFYRTAFGLTSNRFDLCSKYAMWWIVFFFSGYFKYSAHYKI